MNTRIVVSAALVALFAASSQTASADCFATVDLRATNQMGGSDIVRLTNQQNNALNGVQVQVVYPSGVPTTSPGLVFNFDPFQSKFKTVSDIFSANGFGPLGFSLGTWPTRFIRITETTLLPTTNLQGTMTNAKTGSVTPLIFTCEPVV